MRKTLSLALVALAIFATDANARGSHGGGGGAVVITRGVYGPTHLYRAGPMRDATGQVIHVAPAQSQGDAPEIAAVLNNPNASSSLRYRAELCRVLGSYADQMACFNR